MLHACALLVAAVVLVFSTGLEVQFSLPKLVVLGAGATAIGVIWIVRARRGLVRGLPLPVLLSAIALLMWWAVTTLTAVHVPTALRGAHGRYNGFLTHAIWLMLTGVVATAGLSLKEIATLARWSVLAVVPCALYAVVQFAGFDPIAWPGPRSASTIGNPVTLAATLGLSAPVALVMVPLARTRALRRAWIAVVALVLAGIFTTLSRGPFVATACGLTLAAAAMVSQSHFRMSSRALAAAVVAIGLTTAGGYWQLVKTRASVFDAGEGARTWSDRTHAYDVAWRIVQDYPIAGVGLENFSIVYPRYRRPESEQLTPDVVPTMAHSGYLQAAATTGIPGLGLYLTFMAAVAATLVRGWRAAADRPERLLLAGLGGAVAGYLIQDLTGWLEVSATTVFHIYIGMALAATAVRTPPLRSTAAPISTVAVATIGCAMFTVDTVETMRLDRVIHRTRALDARQQWDQIDADLTSVLRSGSDAPAAYLTSAGRRYVERYAATGSPDALARATELIERARHANPFAADPLLLRLSLDAIATHRRQPPPDVEERIAEAIRLDPRNGSVHATIARVRLAQQRHREAMTALETAVVLRPTDPRYDELRGDIEHDRKNQPAALAAYRKAVAGYEAEERALWILASGKLVLKLIEVGSPGEASAHADRVLASFPGQGLMHSLRGYAQQALGNREEAHRSFRTALVIDANDQMARDGLSSLGVIP